MTIVCAKVIGNKVVMACDSGVYLQDIKFYDHAPKAWSYGWLAAGVAGCTYHSEIIKEKLDQMAQGAKRFNELGYTWTYGGLTKFTKVFVDYINQHSGDNLKDSNSTLMLCYKKGIAIMSLSNGAVNMTNELLAIGCDADFMEGFMAAGKTPVEALTYAVDVRDNTAASRPFLQFEVDFDQEYCYAKSLSPERAWAHLRREEYDIFYDIFPDGRIPIILDTKTLPNYIMNQELVSQRQLSRMAKVLFFPKDAKTSEIIIQGNWISHIEMGTIETAAQISIPTAIDSENLEL